MKILIPVFMTLLIVACGESPNSQASIISEQAEGAVDFCTCVNEPISTGGRHKACSKLMDSMTPEESTTKTFACRAALPVPDGGPDLCFCLRTTTSDVEIQKACQAIIPEDMTPKQLTVKMVECSR